MAGHRRGIQPPIGAWGPGAQNDDPDQLIRWRPARSMALNNGGPSPWGNPRPGGPWGTPPPGPPGGGNRGPVPDLDDLIRQAQDAVRRYVPSGGSSRGLMILGAVLVALWAASGFYRVQPDEQGVVLRFGAFNRTAAPGLNYHIPWPVESVETPRVTTENLVFIGYRSGDGAPSRSAVGRDVVE